MQIHNALFRNKVGSCLWDDEPAGWYIFFRAAVVPPERFNEEACAEEDDLQSAGHVQVTQVEYNGCQTMNFASLV